MILMLESNKALSKKLCDLLDQERIICVDSAKPLLEQVVKYKNDLSVIIANRLLIRDIMTQHLILKLSKKLNIKPPPVICYDIDEQGVRKEDQGINEELMENLGLYKLIEYDETDPDFPEVFIETVREAYPGLRADVKKAKVMWMTKPGDFVDIGNWFMDEGVVAGNKPAAPEPVSPKKASSPQAKPDYEKMYHELKKKYDDLLKQMQNLLKLSGDAKEGS